MFAACELPISPQTKIKTNKIEKTRIIIFFLFIVNYAFFIVREIIVIMNNTMKIIANHLAIVYDAPEMNPNPKNPAAIAITKNISDQIIQPLTPFLFFIVLLVVFSI